MNQIINENKKAIGWLSIAHLVNDIYTGFLNPIMPFIAVKLAPPKANCRLVTAAMIL